MRKCCSLCRRLRRVGFSPVVISHGRCDYDVRFLSSGRSRKPRHFTRVVDCADFLEKILRQHLSHH